MKKTLLKNAVRTIKTNMVSWLAIVIVVMMTAGVYFGTFFYADSVDEAIISYADKTGFEDFNILAPAGLKADEIEQIKQMEGIKDLEGTWRISDSSLRFHNKDNDVTIYGLTKRLSRIDLLDGRLPERDGECALTQHVMKENGIKLGDRVELAYGDDLPDDFMKSNSFIVTAKVNHPDSMSTSYDDLVFLAEDAFDKEAVNDNYTCIRVDADIDEYANIKIEDYKAAVGMIRDKTRAGLGPIGVSHDVRTKNEANQELDDARQEAAEKLGKAKRDIEEAEDKIEKAQKKLDKADKKLKDAEEEIADGEEKIEKNKKKLKRAKRKIKSAKKKIRKSEKKLRSAKKKLDKGRKKLNKNKKKLNKSKKKLDKAKREMKKKKKLLKKMEKAGYDTSGARSQLKSAEKKLSEKKKEYKSAKKKIDKAQKEFSGKEKEYNKGKRKLNKAKSKRRAGKRKIRRGEKELKEAEKKLADAKDELEDKKQELIDKKAELADARQELEDGKQEYKEKKEETDAKIADAQKKIDDLKPSSFVFLTRNDMKGFCILKEVAKKCRRLGLVFVVIFSMVGAIVILSTLIILIDNNKKLIGTMKAFGFRSGEILSGYMIYALSASAFGMLLSIALALLIEYIVILNLGSGFIVEMSELRFEFPRYVVIFVLQLLLSGLVTIIGVRLNATRYSALSLMDGSAGKKVMKNASDGKPAGSLYSRLIARNIRTDLSRVITSIIIIGGSCFMMGGGMTLRDAFFGMMPHSAAEIHHYDMLATISERTLDDEYGKVQGYLEGKKLSFAQIRKINTIYHYKDTEEFLEVYVADKDIYPEYIQLTDMDKKTNYIPDKDGILINNRIAENTGLKAGSALILYDEDHQPHAIKAGNICRNYLGRVMYLSKADYQNIFGQEVVNNTFLIRTGAGSREALKEELEKNFDGVSITYTDQMPDSMGDLTTMYNVIVLMTTGLSILLSLFVLLNLVNIYIRHRQNDIIIMAVNGFTRGEQTRYLLRETLITTLGGLILGLVLGCSMTGFLVRIVESNDSMFVRNINIVAWVFGLVMETIFALIINVISYQSLKKLKLTDIMS